MLKRFFSYYKPHMRIFILDMLAALLVAMAGVVYPIITRTMLGDLIPNRKYSLIIVFGIALLLFASLRERLELAAPPKAFQGIPIGLITAGILAMAFVGFSGLC